MITLNTAMAHTLTCFRNRVDDLVAQGISLESAILKIVREDIKYTRPIRFDGNGYSNEWLEEASLRGLDCETSCPLIYDRYLDDASVEMFESMKVMTKYELQARNEIKWDIYTKKVQIEARVFGDLCLNHIIPVVTRYQSVLIDNVRKVMDIFPAEKARQVSANNITLIEKISEHESYIVENVKRLIDARKVANRIADEREKAIAYHDTVAPMIESIRYHIDELEMVVDDEMWSLPKYRELLFIR
jgi:glutamine synthetase